MTPFFKWFSIIVLGVTAVIAAAGIARSDESHMKSVTDPPPDATLMVTQCDEVVVLWIFYEGKLIRSDAEHHPEAQEYEAFLKWAKRGKVDAVVIPCRK